jgi:tRNA U34 5-methylaminomethyl-2-thiouridine-forming methyltransferase MnmC
MERKIIITGDNSKTLLIPDLSETYHSSNGAYNEAIHVFEKAGLALFQSESNLIVFEMGFGTGLNAMVALAFAVQNNLHIDYYSIDATPLEYSLVKELDYLSHFADFSVEKELTKILKCNWDESVLIHKYFTLKKIKGDITSFDFETIPKADLIFFDAFGPRVSPELWESPILYKMHKLLKNNGVLVTYCAQGQFKRNLAAIGFTVEPLPGPPGKREMTRARKK